MSPWVSTRIFLIASLSSKVFIQTISDLVLNEVKKTKAKIENINKAARPVLDRAKEPEEAEEKTSSLKATGFSFDENTKKVLNALGGGKYAWRTLRGIAREIRVARENVLISFNWLLSNRLAETGEKGRWALTLEGRDTFLGMSSVEESKQK